MTKLKRVQSQNILYLLNHTKDKSKLQKIHFTFRFKINLFLANYLLLYTNEKYIILMYYVPPS